MDWDRPVRPASWTGHLWQTVSARWRWTRRSLPKRRPLHSALLSRMSASAASSVAMKAAKSGKRSRTGARG